MQLVLHSLSLLILSLYTPKKHQKTLQRGFAIHLLYSIPSYTLPYYYFVSRLKKSQTSHGTCHCCIIRGLFSIMPWKVPDHQAVRHSGERGSQWPAALELLFSEMPMVSVERNIITFSAAISVSPENLGALEIREDTGGAPYSSNQVWECHRCHLPIDLHGDALERSPILIIPKKHSVIAWGCIFPILDSLLPRLALACMYPYQQFPGKWWKLCSMSIQN